MQAGPAERVDRASREGRQVQQRGRRQGQQRGQIGPAEGVDRASREGRQGQQRGQTEIEWQTEPAERVDRGRGADRVSR